MGQVQASVKPQDLGDTPGEAEGGFPPTPSEASRIEERYGEKPQYLFEFEVRTKEKNGKRKIRYILYVRDVRFDEAFLVVSLRDWYPIIDYLTSDIRYLRDRDFVIEKDRKMTKAGPVDLIKIWFLNTECAWRVTAFVLSILGAEDKPHWVRRMRYVIRLLSPEAIDFWVLTAHDRFVVFKKGQIRRPGLLAVARAMRTLYGKYIAGGVT